MSGERCGEVCGEARGCEVELIVYIMFCCCRCLHSGVCFLGFFDTSHTRPVMGAWFLGFFASFWRN
jgi:hypothetical protein